MCTAKVEAYTERSKKSPLCSGENKHNFSREVMYSAEKHQQQFVANISTDVLPNYTYQ
jgi:hypothetical protein